MKAVLESYIKKKRKMKMKNEEGVLSLDVDVNNVLNREARIAQGPMDKFVTAVTPEVSSGGQTELENSNYTHVVSQFCARWIYQSGLPLNAIDSDSFRSFCEALGQLGPGGVLPSQCELRETLFEKRRRNS